MFKRLVGLCRGGGEGWTSSGGRRGNNAAILGSLGLNTTSNRPSPLSQVRVSLVSKKKKKKVEETINNVKMRTLSSR